MATTSTSVRTNAADLLGGTPVLGPVKEPADLQEAIRAGLPYAALEALEARLGLAHRDLLAVLGTAPRTLARRKQRRCLSPLESDRFYCLAHITQLAVQALGDLDRARAWLGRVNRALGGHTPLSMLDTETGTRQVEEALTHIKYGMYA
jgi:putative toxin-antitoxin system antitoxin component (TIGR02293 family)